MHVSSNCQFTLKTLKPGGLNVSNVKMREGWATILVTTGGSIHVLYSSRSATLLRVDDTLRVEPKWGRASHTNINQIYQSNKHEQCSVFWLAVETQTRIKLWAHTGQWMEPVNTHTHTQLFVCLPTLENDVLEGAHVFYWKQYIEMYPHCDHQHFDWQL